MIHNKHLIASLIIIQFTRCYLESADFWIYIYIYRYIEALEPTRLSFFTFIRFVYHGQYDTHLNRVIILVMPVLTNSNRKPASAL